jgi:predicted HicB family RNase H-like nuclease
MSEEKLDGKSTIELTLDKELLFDLMFMAHERDITLNQLIEEALRLFIEEQEKKL